MFWHDDVICYGKPTLGSRPGPSGHCTRLPFFPGASRVNCQQYTSFSMVHISRGEYFYSVGVPSLQVIFFVQKYSIWSVSCRNIHIMVYCAKILVRYYYMLHENEANQ